MSSHHSTLIGREGFRRDARSSYDGLRQKLAAAVKEEGLSSAERALPPRVARRVLRRLFAAFHDLREYTHTETIRSPVL